jgi:hypothetical protein
MSRTRYYGICRASDRAKVNAALEALGKGPNNFNLPAVLDTKADDSKPTSFTCNWDIDDDELAMIKAAAPNAKFIEIGTTREIRADKVRPMHERVNEVLGDEGLKPQVKDD